MKLIWVCVALGAIGFVKCELGYDIATPFQSLLRDRIDEGEQDTRKYENRIRAELGENSNVQTKSEGDLEEVNEKTINFPQVFAQMRNIYVRCKTEVDKRLKNLAKAKVKSRPSELSVYAASIIQCVKVFGFRALDEILQNDFIRVTDHAYFVRDGTNLAGELPSGRAAEAARSVPVRDYVAGVLGQEWTALACDRFENLLRTHSLKFRLDQSPVSQGRGRRRDHRMFAMMVMGFMIMASILIPMGFQFLTVLGGKSLLLAKMALIMSAINGLKKIATSNVGYGFYHTGSEGHHHDHLHHGFHEKHYHINPQNYNGPQGYN